MIAIVDRKNTAPMIQVIFDRKLPEPAAPKIEPEAPEPKAAPISALAVLQQHENDQGNGGKHLYDQANAH